MNQEIEDRRQRAREAAHDAPVNTDWLGIAIETATQVKITDELIDDLADANWAGGFESRRALIMYALRALGFEVIE